MPSIARLTSVLLALLFIIAAATLDVRPQSDGLTQPWQSAAFAAPGLEDGPEGEEAPSVLFVRSSDGDDQIGHGPHGALVVRVSYERVVPDRDRSPTRPSHPPYAGFPTGPPVA